MEALGPYALLERLSADGALQERFLARRITGGDISGPVVLTRREGSLTDLAGLIRTWCEMAIKREGAGHAGVTRCLEIGAADGYVYEVSEHADGESLWSLLRRYAEQGEHPPLDVALAVSSAFAGLLAELSASGVVVAMPCPTMCS